MILIGGGWLFFSRLSDEIVSEDSASEIRRAIEVEKIKNLAEQNLEFFPVGGQPDILEKLKDNPQYSSLRENDISIDLNYNGNAYPFKPNEGLVPVEE